MSNANVAFVAPTVPVNCLGCGRGFWTHEIGHPCPECGAACPTPDRGGRGGRGVDFVVRAPAAAPISVEGGRLLASRMQEARDRRAAADAAADREWFAATEDRRKVLNATQHDATADQMAAGVKNPALADKAELVAILTVEEGDLRPGLLTERADRLVTWCQEWHDQDCGGGGTYPAEGRRVMLGGAPALMGPFSAALRRAGFEPVFAFSARESRETTGPDGRVTKTSVFVHRGWWPAS